MNNVRHINQSEFSDAEIKAIAIALAPYNKELNNDAVFTLKEAAEFFRYSEYKMREFVRQRLIRVHRINGGDPRFIKSELLEDLKKM